MTQTIAAKIDHTLLAASATKKEISKLCVEAGKYSFYSVCVNPCHVSFCKKILKNSPVKICTVVGFPLGANTTETKVVETKRALKDGADEIDMVVNLGLFRSGRYTDVAKDIKAVRNAAKNKVLKTIIETALLSKNEVMKICDIAIKSGADFIKTSTGFSTRGASLEDVLLLRNAIRGRALIKASGGIKTYKQAVELIWAGADRIGTSASVQIVGGKCADQ